MEKEIDIFEIILKGLLDLRQYSCNVAELNKKF